MPFEALLFDPSSKDSTRAVVRAIGSSLEVTGGAHSFRLDSGKCEVSPGGWDMEAIQISWMAEGGAWMLSTKDPNALVELQRIPPFEAGLASVTQARRKTRRGGRLAVTFVALATLLPALLLLAVFLFRNQIVDVVLSRIPITVDKEVGALFEAEAMRSQSAPPDSEATRAVEAIVLRLESAIRERPFEFRVKIQNNPQVNAFAAPGGLIVVHTGLIKESGSAEELAGVLAHEMAHVTRRHSMRQLIYAGGLIPLVGQLTGQPDAAALVQGLGQLSELKFSRTQEEEADHVGFDTLVAARISTGGMARFFDRLARADGVAPSFLSTHPSSANRATALRERAKAIGGGDTAPLDIDWNAVKASLR
jgi:Zn-dependent protease with chaperone function